VRRGSLSKDPEVKLRGILSIKGIPLQNRTCECKDVQNITEKNMDLLYVCMIVLILTAVLTECSPVPMIIAHRGASYRAPENTLTAVNLAWELGADAVEVDVHLTRDRKIAVIHDPTTKRTAGVELAVSETRSHDLKKLDVGSFKSPGFAGESIPFLEEVIQTIPGGKSLFVEIKCGSEILPEMKQLIDESGKHQSFTIIGFDLETISQCKELMPHVSVCWLAVSEKRHISRTYKPYDPVIIKHVHEHKLDGLDVHFAGITEDFIEAVRYSGMALYVWTVDDPMVARRLKQFGVDGITTNRPAWLRELIT